MSWHWFGPVFSRGPRPPRPAPAAGSAPAGGVAPVGGGVAPVAGGAVTGGVAPVAGGGVAPVAGGVAPAAPAPPRPGSTRRGGGASPWKIRGELTIAAFCGAASGTLITSRRKRAPSGSSI